MATSGRQETASRAGNGQDPALLWAAGGGLLILAGLGGAAVMRRRRRLLDDREDWTGVAVESRADDIPAAPVEPDPAPRYSMASLSVPINAGATLQDMVAAPPTAENPFRTHKRRLARARFLLAQEERQSAARPAPVETTLPPQTIRAEPQTQTVYRLGSGPGNRLGYKPQTR